MIALAVISAAVIAVERWADDSRYVTVEICVEYESALAHADQLGYDSMQSYLSALKESGVVSVGVSQVALADFLLERGVSAFHGDELLDHDALTSVQHPALRSLLDRGLVNRDSLYLLPGDPELALLLESASLKEADRPTAVRLHTSGTSSVIEILSDGPVAEGFQFGFCKHQVQTVADAGLKVVPRLMNPKSASIDAIDAVLAHLDDVEECTTVIFSGTEAFGSPHNLRYTAGRLLEMGIAPGMVEFSVQAGDRQLAQLVDYEVIRIHSIVPSEYSVLSAREMLDRLFRAVSERNVRLLYLRPHLIEPQLEDGNALDFINMLRYRLESNGYVMGPAQAYPRSSPRLLEPLVPVMALGAVALFVLIVLYVYPMPALPQVGLAFVASLAVVGIAYLDKLLARLLLSLGVAVMVPAVAVLVSVVRVSGLSTRRAGHPLISALRGWLLAVFVAVAGGLVVAGILSDRSFFSKTVQFLGVKASHTLPLALAGGLLWWHRHDSELVSGKLSIMKETVDILRAPIRMWHLFAGIAAIVGFVIYLGRTGNTFFIDIPVFDRWLRDTLESFLPVRPRTKEVFVGHPALIVSLYVYAKTKGRCPYALIGVLIGTIGPISVINSFAHLHTPVATTVTRVLLGAALSIPVAICGIVLARILLKWTSWGLESVSAQDEGVSTDSEVCR